MQTSQDIVMDWAKRGAATEEVPVAPAPQKSGFLRRALGDTAVSALKGAIGLPETFVGLADVATGGMAGDAVESTGVNFKKAKELANDWYSPEYKEVQRKVNEATGFVDTIKTMVQNPSSILQSGVESAPSMLSAAGIGRGMLKTGLTKSAGIAGAFGEGLTTTGQQAEMVRQETGDVTMGDIGNALASGGGTALLGVLGAKVANKLGIGDVDTILAGGIDRGVAEGLGAKFMGGDVKKGILRNLVEAGLVEGIAEELPQSMQEQVFQNLSLGKPWHEGVGQAGAQGALVGMGMGAMGGGYNAVVQPAKVEAAANVLATPIATDEQGVFDPAHLQARRDAAASIAGMVHSELGQEAVGNWLHNAAGLIDRNLPITFDKSLLTRKLDFAQPVSADSEVTPLPASKQIGYREIQAPEITPAPATGVQFVASPEQGVEPQRGLEPMTHIGEPAGSVQTPVATPENQVVDGEVIPEPKRERVTALFDAVHGMVKQGKDYNDLATHIADSGVNADQLMNDLNELGYNSLKEYYDRVGKLSKTHDTQRRMKDKSKRDEAFAAKRELELMRSGMSATEKQAAQAFENVGKQDQTQQLEGPSEPTVFVEPTSEVTNPQATDLEQAKQGAIWARNSVKGGDDTQVGTETSSATEQRDHAARSQDLFTLAKHPDANPAAVMQVLRNSNADMGVVKDTISKLGFSSVGEYVKQVQTLHKEAKSLAKAKDPNLIARRNQVNAELDNLASGKESSPRYSKVNPGRTQPLTIPQVKAAIADAVKALPADVQAIIEVVNDPSAFWDGVFVNGKVKLNAAQLYSPSRAREVLLDHELRHMGLSRMFGGPIKLAEAMQKAFAGRENEVAQFALSRGYTSSIEEAVEEWLVSKAKEAKDAPLIAKVVAVFRRWLRGHGFGGLNFSNSEMIELISRSGIEVGVDKVGRQPAGEDTTLEYKEPETQESDLPEATELKNEEVTASKRMKAVVANIQKSGIPYDEYMRKLVDNGTDLDWLQAQSRKAGYSSFKDMYDTVTSEARYHPAYHGAASVHDKFDMNYVGSGEGSKVYGHGLYFAGVKEVAEHYRDLLSKKDLFYKGEKLDHNNAFQSIQEALDSRGLSTTNPGGLITALKNNTESQLSGDDAKVFNAIKSDFTTKTTQKGHVYTVELTPELDEYLDWDKPLSGQSGKVKSALEPIMSSAIFKSKLGEVNNPIGMRVYKTLETILGGDKAASEYLYDLGIRGNKYLNREESGSNFVIFNDRDVEIIARYSKVKVAGKETLIPPDNLIEDNLKISQYSMNDKYKCAMTMMHPDDFLSLAADGGLYLKERVGEYKEFDENKMAALPTFYVNLDTGKIEGHEGRARMTLMKKAGIQSTPVVLFNSKAWSPENPVPKRLYAEREGASSHFMPSFNLIALDRSVDVQGVKDWMQSKHLRYSKVDHKGLITNTELLDSKFSGVGKVSGKPISNVRTTLGALVKHDELFKQHPELISTEVVIKKDPSRHGFMGLAVPSENRIVLYNYNNLVAKKDFNRTLVHEIEHMLGSDEDEAYTSDFHYAKGGPDQRYSKPWFSKMQEVFETKLAKNNPDKPLPSAHYLAILRDKGIKQDEIVQSGIESFLKDHGKVTPNDVLGELSDNALDLQDVVLGETKPDVFFDNPLDGLKYIDDDPDLLKAHSEGKVDLIQQNDRILVRDHRSSPTHFSQFVEPGANERSYREMFVTAPAFDPAQREAAAVRMEELKKEHKYGGMSREDRKNFRETHPEFSKLWDYENKILLAINTHGKLWHDGHADYDKIQNPVVRIRFNEREVNGERVLFVEEMQGPSNANQQKMPEFLSKRIYDIGVKRVLSYAKENGFDRVAWTTGEQQADRYDLSKQIDRIEYEPVVDEETFEPIGKYDLEAYNDSDQLVFSKNEVPEADLEELVGKEITKKIKSGEGEHIGGDFREVRKLSGLDLKVGGEGLTKLYDKTLPALFKKYGGEMVSVLESPKIDTYEVYNKSTGKTLATYDQPNAEYLANRQRDQYEMDNRYLAVTNGYTPVDFGVRKGTTSSTGIPDVLSIPITDKTPDSFARYSAAWHGSPAVHNKFSMNKVGTGEGIQAYGYGLYFASRREVAEHYREQLAGGYEVKTWRIGSSYLIKGGSYQDYSPQQRGIEAEAKANFIESLLIREGAVKEAFATGGLDAARAEMLRIATEELENYESYFPEIVPSYKKLLPAIKSATFDAKELGALYHVELAPKEDEYLLWDEPLSKQSDKVQSAVEKYVPEYKVDRQGWLRLGDMMIEGDGKSELTGRDIYMLFKMKEGGGKDGESKASKFLHSVGIRGIKYLDGGSRADGEGSYNYVVFNDKDIEIIARYSKPGSLLDKLGSSFVGKTFETTNNLLKNIIPRDRMYDKFILSTANKPILDLLKKAKIEEIKQIAKQNVILDEMNDIKDTWVKSAKEHGQLDKVNEFAATATLWGIHGDKSFADQEWDIPSWISTGMQERTGLTLKAAHTIVHNMYTALHPDVKKAYKSLVSQMKSLREQDKSARIEFINNLKGVSVEKKAKLIDRINKFYNTIKGPYLPLGRFGKYAVQVVSVNKSGDRTIVFNQSVDTDYEARKLSALMKEQYGDGYKIELLDTRNIFKRDRINITMDFIDKVKAGLAAKSLSQAKRTANIEIREYLNSVGIDVDATIKNGIDNIKASTTMSELTTAVNKLASIVDDQRLNNEALVGIADALKQAGLDEETRDAIHSEFEDLFLSSQPESSTYKNSISRKGIAGFEKDMLRSAIGYADRHAKSIAYLLHGSKVDAAYRDMNDKAKQDRDNGDIKPEQALTIFRNIKDLQETRQNITSEKVSPIVSAVNKLAFFKFLTSPSTFVVQSTQPWTITLPNLAAKFGFTKSLGLLSKYHSAQLTGGYANSVIETFDQSEKFKPKGWNPDDSFSFVKYIRFLEQQGRAGEANRLLSSLTPGEVDLFALKRAMLDGSINVTQSHEAREYLMGGGKSSELTKKLANGFSWFMQTSELTSRKAAFLAAFQCARSTGKSIQESVISANQVIRETLYDYSQLNRPKMLTGNIGRLVGQFRVYQVQTISHLINLGLKSINASKLNTTPQERAQARKELTYIALMNFMFAGAAGVPLSGSAVALLGMFTALFSTPDDPFDFLEEAERAILETEGGKVVLKGLPMLIGMDISKRVGMGGIEDIISGEPPEKANAVDRANWYAAKILGPGYNVVSSSLFGAMEGFKTGKWNKAMQAVLPKPMADVARAWGLNENGVKDYTGTVVIPADQVSVGELALMAAGVNPSRIAVTSQRSRTDANVNARIESRQKALRESLYDAIKDQDHDGIQAAVEDIVKFNTGSPIFALKVSDLQSGVLESMKRAYGVVGKQSLKLDLARNNQG